jgi:hypothetical protein
LTVRHGICNRLTQRGAIRLTRERQLALDHAQRTRTFGLLAAAVVNHPALCIQNDASNGQHPQRRLGGLFRIDGGKISRTRPDLRQVGKAKAQKRLELGAGASRGKAAGQDGPATVVQSAYPDEHTCLAIPNRRGRRRALTLVPRAVLQPCMNRSPRRGAAYKVFGLITTKALGCGHS